MFSESRYSNVAIILVGGGCGGHFQNGHHEFSMSHISANNIDRKLICVSLCLISGPHNPNTFMVNILVCGVCGSHFQNGRCKLSMSLISANNGVKNFNVGVNIYVFRFEIILTLYKHCFFNSKWRPI